MSTSVTSGTYIRNLSYSLRRKLSDFLDPQDRWKDVIVSIRKPNGDPRYSQHHVRRFEGIVLQGKSPTVELLADWGTTNSTVGELVDILKSHKLLAAANVLLPVEEAVPAEPKQVSESVETYSALPTKPLVDAETQPPPTSSVVQTQILLDSSEPGHTGFSSFLYKELIQITGNFDDRAVSDGGSRLGEGGFGTVYKGVLNNKPVAVKKTNSNGRCVPGGAASSVQPRDPDSESERYSGGHQDFDDWSCLDILAVLESLLTASEWPPVGMHELVLKQQP